jgi:hypothetical protein
MALPSPLGVGPVVTRVCGALWTLLGAAELPLRALGAQDRNLGGFIVARVLRDVRAPAGRMPHAHRVALHAPERSAANRGQALVFSDTVLARHGDDSATTPFGQTLLAADEDRDLAPSGHLAAGIGLLPQRHPNDGRVRSGNLDYPDVETQPLELRPRDLFPQAGRTPTTSGTVTSRVPADTDGADATAGDLWSPSDSH